MKGSRIASFDGYIVAQMIAPITVDPQSDKSVKITGKNCHPDIYLYDGASHSARRSAMDLATASTKRAQNERCINSH